MNKKITVLPYQNLHIHGDNIVECERALSLIMQALEPEFQSLSLPAASIVCPQYKIGLASDPSEIFVTFYPGFGRWQHDILKSIRERGGVLREAADVIVTGIQDGAEVPLFAIEFCGALPAGNQAWQRSGRAFSFGAAKLPYLYISELGGFELDSDRNRKAPRTPNPAVPFSYLAYSIENDTPVFPIFVTAPGADEASRAAYNNEFADGELAALVRAYILDVDDDEVFDRLKLKVLSFVQKKAATARGGVTLSSDQWASAYAKLSQKNQLSEFLLGEAKQPWSKTAYIAALTDHAKKLMVLGSKFGTGLTSKNLPLCLIAPEKRSAFLAELRKLYPSFNAAFLEFMDRTGPLAICWVSGFKPRGDDARPDRGLAPLARMLVGAEHDLMTIVYGPAPASTWPTLEKTPSVLAERNGLWESILEISDAVLVESKTDKVSQKGYARSHWFSELPVIKPSKFFVPPVPSRLGENDVDTALHLLLAKFLGGSAFEGMCNPPGGDWSGVSILDLEKGKEFRWISLPRVSGPETKRPDHVFQFSSPDNKPIILSIESKEVPRTLETGIGPHLTAYLHYLFGSAASIERNIGNFEWSHSVESVRIDQFDFATAGAFLNVSDEAVADAVARSGADLNFAVSFGAGSTTCEIEMITSTPLGVRLAKFIEASFTATTLIKIKTTHQ